MKQGDRVLIDTNAIIEAHRLGCWPALCGYFSMETVEECVAECATGDQFREGRVPIDVKQLKQQLTAAHPVDDAMLAGLAVTSCGASTGIDDGEKHLLAYAITQSGIYLLCSPDKACMRVGQILHLLERFTSLQRVAEKSGHLGLLYAAQYTEKWHRTYRSRLVLETLE